MRHRLDPPCPVAGGMRIGRSPQQTAYDLVRRFIGRDASPTHRARAIHPAAEPRAIVGQDLDGATDEAAAYERAHLAMRTALPGNLPELEGRRFGAPDSQARQVSPDSAPIVPDRTVRDLRRRDHALTDGAGLPGAPSGRDGSGGERQGAALQSIAHRGMRVNVRRAGDPPRSIEEPAADLYASMGRHETAPGFGKGAGGFGDQRGGHVDVPSNGTLAESLDGFCCVDARRGRALSQQPSHPSPGCAALRARVARHLTASTDSGRIAAPCETPLSAAPSPVDAPV